MLYSLKDLKYYTIQTFVFLYNVDACLRAVMDIISLNMLDLLRSMSQVSVKISQNELLEKVILYWICVFVEICSVYVTPVNNISKYFKHFRDFLVEMSVSSFPGLKPWPWMHRAVKTPSGGKHLKNKKSAGWGVFVPKHRGQMGTFVL